MKDIGADIGIDIGDGTALGCNGGLDDSIGCWNACPPDIRSCEGAVIGDVILGADTMLGDDIIGITPLPPLIRFWLGT